MTKNCEIYSDFLTFCSYYFDIFFWFLRFGFKRFFWFSGSCYLGIIGFSTIQKNDPKMAQNFVLLYVKPNFCPKISEYKSKIINYNYQLQFKVCRVSLSKGFLVRVMSVSPNKVIVKQLF